MTIQRFIAGAVLAGFAGVAAAEPSSQLAWTTANLSLVKAGSADKGKQLAATCAGCHTPDRAPADGTPMLQGQLATYLYKQLFDYKQGSRANPVMSGVAKTLSEADMADLAAYYAGLEPPAGTKSLLYNEAGERLVEKGDSKRILPPCQVCHEPNGLGQRIDVPALAGQNAAYLEQTLLDYKSGARHNDLYGRMRGISEQLSPEEIKDLARYYGTMGR